MAIQKNFNIVGNPTITEEGIASNFSTINYLTLSGIETSISDTSWTLQIGLTTPTSETSHSQFFLGNINSYNGVVFQLYQNKLTAYLGTGSSWDITSGTIESTENLSLGTFYYISLSYTGTSYSLKYSTNKIDWVEVFNIATNSKVILKDLLVGACWDLIDGQVFKGSVDLKELKITSNGEEVWNAWKDVGVIPGSVTVNKGYYNADGTNIIKFTSPITKTLTEAAIDLSHKNDVVLTLDSEGTSSFVLNGSDKTLTGYKKTRKLDSPSIYVDPSKKYILGTEPTVINASVKSQNPGGIYKLEYLTLNGSVSYDETTGKLSGFSTSNYATSSSGITFGNSFDLIFNVTVSEESLEQTLFYGKEDRGLYLSGSKICAWFGSNISGTTSITSGTTYWIRLIWDGTTYTTYSLVDDGTYTLQTLPELSSWTQEFTYSSSSNIFAPGYWVGYHSQAPSQYARSTFNMGKAQMTTNGVTYRYANGDAEPGNVSFTQGWLYNQTQNRTYQNKDTAPVSVEQLKENNAEGATIGYKNSLGLKFDQSSDVSFPILASTFGGVYNYNFNQDVYLDNTKTKILGTTAMSDSWVVEPNYTVVGSPTVSDNGDATRFSDSNYLTIPNPFTSTMNRFTLITSFTTTNNTVSNSGIFDSPNGKTNIRLTITDTGKLHFRISTTGAQTYPVDITGTTTIENNKKYWAKVEYDNSANYSIYLSEDGHVWNQEAFAIITDRPYYTSGIQNSIGDNTANGSYFEGTLHLADWSITVDGVKVWEYLKKPYSINTGTSSTDTGSITYTAGYKYINETNGSFFVQTNTTKTLEQLVAGDKTEQMGLYLVIKTDKTTDFVLSSTTPTTDISYAEKIVDVYLDRTLSYIYGTIADPRVKFTINATPNTATVRMVDLAPSTPVQVSGIGTATILVDPSYNVINYGVSAEGYKTKGGTVTAIADSTLDVVLEADTPAERTEPTTPTDTFYAWINQDNPNGNNWFTLTESPIGEDYLYMSDATANNNYPLGVVSSTGAAGQTLNATSIQATIQNGNLVFGTTGTVYTRTPSSDGEYTLFHTWVDDTLYNTYLTLKTIPVDGDVVYGYNTGTGELTNAGTIGNQWDYVEGAGNLNHVSGAPTGEGMVEPFTYIWIRSTTIPS